MKANHKQKLFQEPKLKNHHKKNQTCINKNNIRKVIPKETRKKLKLTNHNFLKFLDGDEKSHLVLTLFPILISTQVTACVKSINCLLHYA